MFWLANILPNLDKISISVRDVVAAFAGSIIVLAIRWVWIAWPKGREGSRLNQRRRFGRLRSVGLFQAPASRSSSEVFFVSGRK